MKKYKLSRVRDDKFRKAVSQKLQGHKVSKETRMKISESMKRAWATIPKLPTKREDNKK